MWPALISAGSNLISGLLGSAATKDANAARAADAASERARQQAFAESGIQMRVADAKKAGIHPLYALGANVSMPSPVSVGVETDMGPAKAMANMGQDISRAVNATRSQPERDQAFVDTANDLTLKNAALRNELLSAQIAKLRSSSNPPMPTSVDTTLKAKDPEDTTSLMVSQPIVADRRVSDAQEFENRYGEVGENVAGPYVAWRDYVATSGGTAAAHRMNPFHLEPRDPARRWWLQNLEKWRDDYRYGRR